METDFFIFFKKDYRYFENLTPEEGMKLLKALCEYDPANGEIPESMKGNNTFLAFKDKIDYNYFKKYLPRKENGKKGGRPKKETTITGMKLEV